MGVPNGFEIIWEKIQTHLRPGERIPNWSVAHGYLGRISTVIRVSIKSITYKGATTPNLQTAPKEDFMAVWQVWKKYLAQEIPRRVLRDMTRFSTYMISTLRWLEEKQ